jgi:hypothetical protein
MRETENIFDTSTTLTEIDEPTGGDADFSSADGPAPGAGGEPDYFTPNPAQGHTDARRRALSVLGLVGGGIFTVVLISAATGSGENRAVSTSKGPAQGERPVGGRTATIVAPKRAPQARPRRKAATRTRSGEARGRHRPGQSKDRAAAPAHRRHHSPAPESTAPPPEPSYTPEPEPSYVPVEETAPPPPPSTPPPSSSSGGAQQEFGFEP